MEISPASKYLEECVGLCFNTISFSIDREMNADVVCHSLRLCKQDPGQPLCHLYPAPKVSYFSTSFKAAGCGWPLRLGPSMQRFPGHVSFLGKTTAFRKWTLSGSVCLSRGYTTYCLMYQQRGCWRVGITGPGSLVPAWAREKEYTSISFSPDFIVKQTNNSQPKAQQQFTYSPVLPWHNMLSFISVTTYIGPSFPCRWGLFDLAWSAMGEG